MPETLHLSTSNPILPLLLLMQIWTETVSLNPLRQSNQPLPHRQLPIWLKFLSRLNLSSLNLSSARILGIWRSIFDGGDTVFIGIGSNAIPIDSSCDSPLLHLLRPRCVDGFFRVGGEGDISGYFCCWCFVAFVGVGLWHSAGLRGSYFSGIGVGGDGGQLLAGVDRGWYCWQSTESVSDVIFQRERIRTQ